MALQTVVIKVKGDSKGLDPTIQKLQKLGKIDKDNAQQFKKSSKEFQDSTKKSGSLMKGLGKQALVLGTALVGAFAIKQVVGSAINIIKDFEKEMSTLRSITGSTAKEMEFFKKAALDIGRATKTSATEVVKAFTLIGSAQPQLLKNQKALASVTEQALILSKAAGIDAVQAAEALTGAMNQFGASASEAAKFTDIFATSQQKGSSFIVDTSEALINAGAAASAAGLSFETTNAAIQALSAGNIKGARAGTALRGVLSKLSAQADDEINPSMIGLSKTIEVLASRNLGLKEATKLVGEEGATGLLTLIKQRDLFNELDGSLNEVGNAMEQMRINTDNLDGSLEEVNNAWEEFILSMSGSQGILKNVVDFFSSFLQGATDYINIRTRMAGADVSYFTKLKASFGVQSAMDEIMEATKETIEETVEATANLEEETEKYTSTTRLAGSAVKAFKKLIAELKTELEEQALAGGLSARTLKEYLDAVKKAEAATKLFSDAIADQNIKLMESIDPLKQVFEEELKLIDIKERVTFDDDDLIRIRSFWETYGDGIRAVGDLAVTFADIKTGLLERELQEEEEAFTTRSEALQKEFDNKLITEETFNEGKIKLESDFNKKMAEFQTKQAKASKAAAIFSSVINTFAAVIAALVSIPPNVPLSIIVGVTGAAQTAAIAAKPIPKFHTGKRGEFSDEEINAKVLRSEYVIPPEPSRKHRADLDAMLNNKFEKFVFMKYQMPIIKQYSQGEQAGFSDFDITRHQRKHSKLLEENNQILRGMMPLMKRASQGWE